MNGLHEKHPLGMDLFPVASKFSGDILSADCTDNLGFSNPIPRQLVAGREQGTEG
jgi:hypothetical protein